MGERRQYGFCIEYFFLSLYVIMKCSIDGMSDYELSGGYLLLDNSSKYRAGGIVALHQRAKQAIFCL